MLTIDGPAAGFVPGLLSFVGYFLPSAMHASIPQGPLGVARQPSIALTVPRGLPAPFGGLLPFHVVCVGFVGTVPSVPPIAPFGSL